MCPLVLGAVKIHCNLVIDKVPRAFTAWRAPAHEPATRMLIAASVPVKQKGVLRTGTTRAHERGCTQDTRSHSSLSKHSRHQPPVLPCSHTRPAVDITRLVGNSPGPFSHSNLKNTIRILNRYPSIAAETRREDPPLSASRVVPGDIAPI